MHGGHKQHDEAHEVLEAVLAVDRACHKHCVGGMLTDLSQFPLAIAGHARAMCPVERCPSPTQRPLFQPKPPGRPCLEIFRQLLEAVFTLFSNKIMKGINDFIC